MIDRTTKLRWRRGFRRRQRQLEDIGAQTEEHLDRHFFRRLGRLYEVRRFLLSWILLLILLIGVSIIQFRSLGGYYQVIKPIAGGIYTEGMVGSFTNANPVFATGEADTAVSRLLFSSLMQYDAHNHLVGDLATDVQIDASAKIYTVKIRRDAYWHDGRELKAADVVFTYQTIQNPDVRSPLFSAWQGIKVEAPDDYTVVFTLPSVLASFSHALTNGIIPKHILEKNEASSLRSALFNTTEPIGSGPFKWAGVEVSGTGLDDREQKISLIVNRDYFKGRPKINGFNLHIYLSETTMFQKFIDGSLTSLTGVQVMPDEIKRIDGLNEYNIPFTGAVMVFLRTSHDILKETEVRKALMFATDQQALIRQLEYPSLPVNGPLLKGMTGYIANITQHGHNLNEANAILDKAGWAKGADGLRSKNGQKLAVDLQTLNTAEYATVAKELQRQWREAGIDVVPSSLEQTELQASINTRSYGALLYGISLGVDPDQYAYWHSSQADVLSARRLNFSDYRSKAADAALEAGRTRIDAVLRAAKYKPFLEAWRDDAPAIALYQPRLLYISREKIYNFDQESVNISADRFANIENWMIRTTKAAP